MQTPQEHFDQLEAIFSGFRFGYVIAKGRGQKAEGRREKIDGPRFQYLALSQSPWRLLYLRIARSQLTTSGCNPLPSQAEGTSFGDFDFHQLTFEFLNVASKEREAIASRPSHNLGFVFGILVFY